MSVYHNTYVQSYMDEVKRIEENKRTTDMHFFEIYYTMLINTFKWGGEIPEGLPSFKIEDFYQLGGRIAGFNIGKEFAILPAFPQGSLTRYGEFDKYVAVDAEGNTYDLEAKDCVIGFNNSFKMPYFNLVQSFSEKSSFALRAVDTSLRRAMKGTILTGLSDSQMKIVGDMIGDTATLKEIVAIPIENGLDPELIKRFSVFDNRETDVLAQWDVYIRYRNLFYSTFGINNVEIQKRERLTEAEGSGNDEIVRYTLLDDMYRLRKDFCQKVKEKFGKEITVEIQRDSVTVYELNKSNDEKIKSMEIEITKGSNLPMGSDNKEEPVNESEVE